MIRVTIYKDEKHQCVGFKAHGHAGFSEEGQDIVCAAVSVLTINTLNAIEKFADDRTSLVSDESKGLIDYRLKGNPHSARQSFCLTRWFLVWKKLQKMRTTENIWI